MNFDVVISNPPYKRRGWLNHVEKHLYLLDKNSHYILVCPADTSTQKIRDISNRFNVVKSKRVEHLTAFDDDVVSYYIWKK